jgi:hypothetical protein
MAVKKRLKEAVFRANKIVWNAKTWNEKREKATKKQTNNYSVSIENCDSYKFL